MTPVQLDWMARMRSSLEQLHNEWYFGKFKGHDWLTPQEEDYAQRGGMDKALFAEVDRKIREACSRLNIEVQDVQEAAEQNDYWDGEMNGDLVVLGDALDKIVKAKG